MSSVYVVPVEIQDNAVPTKTFWLTAIISSWDDSQIWQVINDDLNSRNYKLVNLGEKDLWDNVRHWWPNNGQIDWILTEAIKENRPLWCKDKIPVRE